MVVSILCLLILFCVTMPVVAQSQDSEYYYPYDMESEEQKSFLLPDSTIFYRAIQSSESIFLKSTDFNFMHIRTKRRGLDYGLSKSISVNGVDLPYRYITPLKSLSVEELRSAGMRSSLDMCGGVGDLHLFRIADQEAISFYQAAVNFSSKDYLVGAKISMAEVLQRGWSVAASMQMRTGRDLMIGGVFSNSGVASVKLTKRLGQGEALSFVATLAPTMRGLRFSSVEETFQLTGDNLYNPSWGFQADKERNANVRREFVPLALASYMVDLTANTSLVATAGVEVGERKYSSLGWYDARTPIPDNYRYLPSYSGDRDVEQAWRSEDARYTQIDWDELIAQNEMSADGHAAYALEDRVESLVNGRMAVNMATDIGNRLRVSYGVKFNTLNSRYFKRMRDLLGATNIVDIDQFLVGDDMYSNRLQNNMREPNRRIGEGDTFGYDYSLRSREVGVSALVQYQTDRLHIDVGAEIEDVSMSRVGHYEKELFASGNSSYGDSKVSQFTPYSIKMLLGWSFSPRSYIEMVGMVGGVAPYQPDIFVQPLYNNRVVDDLQLQNINAAELNYRYVGGVAELQLSAFLIETLNEMDGGRFYDDISGVYCDMTISGIGKLRYGVEVASSIQISRRWRAAVAATVGQYIYSRNPRVTILSDRDNSAIAIDSESYMGGCRVGSAPQIMSSGTINYFGRNGWGFNATLNYAGLRYVEPMPMRRTARVLNQAGSPEVFNDFMHQERLGDSFTFDASLFKTFYMERSRVVCALMLRNILNDRSIVSSAYESSRVRRYWSGDTYYFKPFENRRTYAYPRSFYLSISYKL